MKDNTYYITNIDNWNDYLSKVAILDSTIKIKYNETGEFPSCELRHTFGSKSNKQLRAYWRLVVLIMHFFNETGQCNYKLDKEQTSDMLLIEAGLYETIRGNKIAKSLKTGGSMTKEEMTGLLQYIVDLGERMEIADCVITSYDKADLLKYYN